jgi:hypothetical protein
MSGTLTVESGRILRVDVMAASGSSQGPPSLTGAS